MGSQPVSEKGARMLTTRSVGIIGMGHVGAHVASALLSQGLADELRLCDIDEKKLAAEVQDLHDALLFHPYNTKIVNCGDVYEELSGCDIIVNAAGNVAASSTDRDGELFCTTDICRTFAERVAGSGFAGIWVNISNPCDVIATEIWHLTGYDPNRIIGTGTALDSARLRAQISLACGDLDPKSIDAHMIGEHGFSQIAAWSPATIGGVPLSRLARDCPERFAFDHDEVEELARRGGYVAMAGKRCTEYAIAAAAARIVAAILHDEHAVMAASTLMRGQYGEEGIFASLPCVIGKNGVEQVFELDLSEEELAGFHGSCAHIRENIARLTWW